MDYDLYKSTKIEEKVNMFYKNLSLFIVVLFRCGQCKEILFPRSGQKNYPKLLIRFVLPYTSLADYRETDNLYDIPLYAFCELKSIIEKEETKI